MWKIKAIILISIEYYDKKLSNYSINYSIVDPNILSTVPWSQLGQLEIKAITIIVQFPPMINENFQRMFTCNVTYHNTLLLNYYKYLWKDIIFMYKQIIQKYIYN